MKPGRPVAQDRDAHDQACRSEKDGEKTHQRVDGGEGRDRGVEMRGGVQHRGGGEPDHLAQDRDDHRSGEPAPGAALSGLKRHVAGEEGEGDRVDAKRIVELDRLHPGAFVLKDPQVQPHGGVKRKKPEGEQDGKQREGGGVAGHAVEVGQRGAGGGKGQGHAGTFVIWARAAKAARRAVKARNPAGPKRKVGTRQGRTRRWGMPSARAVRVIQAPTKRSKAR